MLANLSDLLIPAAEQKDAVGHFNVTSWTMARGVVKAAEELDAPVILGIEERQLVSCPLDEFASFAVNLAEKASVPVALHFDHGYTFETCIEALDWGFTSINYDCSKDSFEENVSKVANMARIAHAFGASLEAELGYTPEASELAAGGAKNYYTVPEQAADYVRATGIDALAISVGTAQGTYTVRPRIDYKRIEAIASAVPIPLVLHGGSGLSDRTIRHAISSGISKIDIFTDPDLRGGQGCIQAINDGVTGLTGILPYAEFSVKVTAQEKIRLFQNA